MCKHTYIISLIQNVTLSMRRHNMCLGFNPSIIWSEKICLGYISFNFEGVAYKIELFIKQLVFLNKIPALTNAKTMSN